MDLTAKNIRVNNGGFEATITVDGKTIAQVEDPPIGSMIINYHGSTEQHKQENENTLKMFVNHLRRQGFPIASKKFLVGSLVNQKILQNEIKEIAKHSVLFQFGDNYYEAEHGGNPGAIRKEIEQHFTNQAIPLSAIKFITHSQQSEPKKQPSPHSQQGEPKKEMISSLRQKPKKQPSPF